MINKGKVQTLLLRHIGRSNPIKKRHIMSELGIPVKYERQLRETICELRHEGFSVLFASGKPAGYYLPANQAELDAGIQALRDIVKDECITIRDLKVKGAMFIRRLYQGRLL